MSRVTTAVVAGCVAAAAATLAAAPAQAAPQGHVNTGLHFGAHYGTGCSYSMTVPVNASGLVSFYDRVGGKTVLVGRTMAQGGSAAVTWWPKRQGLHRVYAEQHGQRSPESKVRVTQGYGRGGLCITIP